MRPNARKTPTSDPLDGTGTAGQGPNGRSANGEDVTTRRGRVLKPGDVLATGATDRLLATTDIGEVIVEPMSRGWTNLDRYGNGGRGFQLTANVPGSSDVYGSAVLVLTTRNCAEPHNARVSATVVEQDGANDKDVELALAD